MKKIANQVKLKIHSNQWVNTFILAVLSFILYINVLNMYDYENVVPKIILMILSALVSALIIILVYVAFEVKLFLGVLAILFLSYYILRDFSIFVAFTSNTIMLLINKYLSGSSVEFADVYQYVITLLGIVISIAVPLFIIHLNNKNNEKNRLLENELKYIPILYSPKPESGMDADTKYINNVRMINLENYIFINNTHNMDGVKYKRYTRRVCLLNLSDYAIYNTAKDIKIIIDDTNLFDNKVHKPYYQESIPYSNNTGLKFLLNGKYSAEELVRLKKLKVSIKLSIKNLLGFDYEVILKTTMNEDDEVLIEVNKV